ncbi:unnamed protein product, partial [Discosporangium mesarthrocarpum]
VVDPTRRKGEGEEVLLGDVVALLDDNGLAWNTNTHGVTGYLDLRPHGSKGELHVSFRVADREEKGAAGEACEGRVLYGQEGVSLVAERRIDGQSHGHSTWEGVNGMRRRPRLRRESLRVFKKGSSHIAGGYLCCDTRGEEVTFQICPAS